MQRWKAKKFAFGNFPRNASGASGASGASRQLRACLLSHEKREKITPVIQAIVIMNSQKRINNALIENKRN